MNQNKRIHNKPVTKETVLKCMKMIDAGMKCADIGGIVGYSHSVPTRIRNAMDAIAEAKKTGDVSVIEKCLNDRASRSVTSMVCDIMGYIPKHEEHEQKQEQKTKEPESDQMLGQMTIQEFEDVASLKKQTNALINRIDKLIVILETACAYIEQNTKKENNNG